MRLLRRLLIPLCLTLLVAAACGDDADTSAGADPEASATPDASGDPIATDDGAPETDTATDGDTGIDADTDTGDAAVSGLAPSDGESTTDQPIPVEPDGGIGDSPFGSVPFFGANDDQCTSVVLTNSADDETLRTAALDCFFAEHDAGTPVVVDLSIATVEGDAIYHRYLYDGSAVTIVIDNRADSFGSGTVDAQTCANIAPGEFLPVGVDCVPIADHPGFPEAEG